MVLCALRTCRLQHIAGKLEPIGRICIKGGVAYLCQGHTAPRPHAVASRSTAITEPVTSAVNGNSGDVVCVAWVSKYRNSFILFVSNTVRLWVTKSSFRCTYHSRYARECNRTFPQVGRWRDSRCKARTPLCPTKVPIQSPDHSCSIGFLSLHISRYLLSSKRGEKVRW